MDDLVKRSPRERASELFLDKLPNGRVQLTDVGTCETKVFNGGGIWHLVVDDEDGDAVVVQTLDDESIGECHVVQEIFKLELWRHGESVFMGEYGANGQIATAPVLLETLKCNMRPGEVQLRVGDNLGGVRLGVYTMSRRRAGGQLVFWNCVDLYAALALNSFGGEPIKWIGRNAEKWTTRIQDHFHGDHIIMSNHASRHIDVPPSKR